MNPCMARIGWLLVTSLLSWYAPSTNAAQRATQVPRPNIVLILADDLGIHDLGAYGRVEHRTPRLDRFAREGLRFTSAYCAQPICSASRAALLTGKGPARLHLTTYLPGRRDTISQRVLHPVIPQALPRSERTLAEHLKDVGYATACVGKWHLGGAGFGPDQQGFGFVHAGRAQTTPSDDEGSKGESGLTDAAIRFLHETRKQPFFLLLSHHTPHIPYAAHPRERAAFEDAFEPGYAAVIARFDHAVGRVLDELDTLGLRESTLVIVTSDNGGLHVPELDHARVTHNGPFRAGKGYLYEGGLRIPLLVRWPAGLRRLGVTDVPVINTDWLPTLLELCGLPPPDLTDGLSLARFLTERQPLPQRRLTWHFPHYTNQGGRPSGAIREGPWKLAIHDDTDSAELFRLDRDPGEHTNLAEHQPRRVQRLRNQLEAWRNAVGAQRVRPNPDCQEAKFRALYLDFAPSRFRPIEARGADWERVAAWRLGMDAAAAIAP